MNKQGDWFCRGRGVLRLAGLLAWAGCAGAAGAQDWPGWRGPEGNGRAPGFAAPKAWPGALHLRWRVAAGAGDATPALVGERVYVFGREGEEEVVRCLDAREGRELWRQAYAAAAVTGPAAAYAGPRSSPAVSGGRVVTLGVGGVLAGWEAATGRLVWRQEKLTAKVPRFFTAMSPLVAGGRCVAHLGGEGAGLLVALRVDDGQVEWRRELEGPAYASPALLTAAPGGTQIVVQAEQHLLGVAWRDGAPLWQVATAPRPGYWNSASPVVDGATVYYTGQGTGTRAVRIEAEGNGWQARMLWHNPEVGTVYNTPVLKDGRLFGVSDRGRFFCLDAATGRTEWQSTNRVSNFSPLVDAGGALAALPEKSGLIFFLAAREGCTELARYPVSETPVYAFPVLSGRRVLVREREHVALWELGEGEEGVREGAPGAKPSRPGN